MKSGIPVLFLSLLCFITQAEAVDFPAAFTENFDSMGDAGTAPPSGWSLKNGATSPATSKSTWTASIAASGSGSVADMIAAGTPLIATSSPTTTNNNGFNAQGTSTTDRVLATSPTGTAGCAIELSLTNTSGASLNKLGIGYETRRFTAAAAANQLPGYWLFYSLDNGASWANVSALNPTISTVPNTVGVTVTPSTAVTLASNWANGATLLLRWVDDNAAGSSPDQIIGLDHVTITDNPPEGSGALTRDAYLQQAGPTTMTIRWRSSQAVTGLVKYGVSTSTLTNTANEISSTTDHEVTLNGLSANTTYYYSIGSAYDTLAGGDTAHKFTTPPTPGSTPSTRIWVLGDAGTGNSDQTNVRDAYYTWTGSRDPSLVLQLGDNAYDSGYDNEFQSKVFDIYGSLMKRVPFWSCLGNHETNDLTNYVDTYPYFHIYTFPKSAECGGVSSGTEHYYSFDYGNIHFISLDSMTASRSPTGAMATWLTNDLASTTRTWIIAFFHHPPYTKGAHNSDTATESVEMRSNILPILEAGGVDLVLSGHSHSYERSYLLDGHYGLSGTLTSAMKKNAGGGRPAESGAYMKPLTGPRDHFGSVYAVPGSSGKISGGSLNHPAHFISLNNLGSLVLDVNGTRLDATFIRENGSIPDTFTIIKQGAADTDHDGISDAYEIANGLNRYVNDASSSADSDGLSNFLEFAFGLNAQVNDGALVEVNIPAGGLPKRGTPNPWVRTTTNGTDFRVVFIRRKDAAEAGLVYTPQFSSDLLHWSNSNVTPIVVADGGEVEAVSLDYPLYSPGVNGRFFRVAVMTTH